jgi:hypothetical protein
MDLTRLEIINQFFINPSNLSKSKDKLRMSATMEAFKSDCNAKHGALITRGKTIMARGCNTSRCKYLRNIKDCCQHAEMNVATKFINCVVRPNRRKYCVLWKREGPPPLQS